MKELQQCHELYFVDPGLLIYIEEALGVYLPDEEVLTLDKKDANVGTLIDAVLRHQPIVVPTVECHLEPRDSSITRSDGTV